MSDEDKEQRSDADAELQREILKDRKFSLTEAIGRMAGPGALKGVSPIARKQQAEAEGLEQIFKEAGFSWNEPGCSMCIAMNDDKVGEGERCASTSNRNFEGRQGKGSRTHLVSPMMAAAAAIAGHFTDIREWS